MSGFFDKDTMKSLEGKYLKFQDGVTRELKLVAHRVEQKDGNYGPYSAHVLDVIDQEVGEAKELTASKSLMQSLAKLNNRLEVGVVLLITPKSKTIMTSNGQKEVFDFHIEIKGDEGIDSPKL